MFKRRYSLNLNMPKKDDILQSNNLTRLSSFRTRTSPSEESLSPETVYNNPKLINGYIPIVREVSKDEAIIALQKMQTSLKTEGWLCQSPKKERWKSAEQKKAWHEDLIAQASWKKRSRRALAMVSSIKETLKKSPYIIKKSEDYAFFILYIGIVPIGAMVLVYHYYDDEESFEYNTPVYPEVSLLVSHPGIRNCAYLLIEKAVNKSYQVGCLGNLKLSVKDGNEILSQNVYSKMGFIKLTGADMSLNPSTSSLWQLSASEGYRFIGLC
ncbi:hypothetical protein [Xenorhabdus bharatensis]|uniref:hypothetical protein n=1 Tax=Xenorhabdus bharatensis TaxID=3136256 RepID=UPI0030F3A48C